MQVNGIELCYAADGDAARPTVLLVHGIGCQLVQWPQSLIRSLVDAGFHVVRMDNRDVGLSQKMDALGSADIPAVMMAVAAGRPPRPPYALADMAHDAMGLLTALGIPRAHIVGVSMGGMIAQRIAIHHPQRVLSLTAVMSSSGAAGLPPPDPAAIASIMAPPTSTDRAAVLAQLRESWNLIGGPHFKSTDLGFGRMTELAFDRGRHPAGFLRQMAAIIADSDRAEQLCRIAAPTLVIHGDADALVPLPCGADIAQRIPGARFLAVSRMGHDLPEPLLPQITAALLEHFTAAGAR